MKLIAPPTYIPKEQYSQLTEKIKNIVFETEGIISMYQMGSVKDPGISDLDLICVFNDGVANHLNIREKLTPEEKQILTHSLFGIHEKFLNRSLSYGLISNLKLIKGRDVISEKTRDVYLKIEDYKTQIAFEYLLKMYISLEVQLSLGIVKLRSFLLLAKAISFDLELLGVHDGKLYEMVKKIIDFRKNWFIQPPTQKEVKKTIHNFYNALKGFLNDLLNSDTFYLPFKEANLPGNFKILQHPNFTVNHKGIILPSHLSFLGKKYINLQHRFNRFEFQIPFDSSKENPVIDKRFQFYAEHKIANKKNLPYFLPLTTSLSFE